MRGMPDTDAAALEVESQSEAETIAFGRQLGASLHRGDIVLLCAPFGAGKTHLTKGIAAAFGVAETDVNSPSFVLINEYEADRAHGRIPIYHVDLYRVETPDELATVGLDDVVAGDGIAIIEWADRAAGRVPESHLAIVIEHVDETRRLIRVVPRGERYRQLVDLLRRAEADASARALQRQPPLKQDQG